jgi:hypothetical protein
MGALGCWLIVLYLVCEKIALGMGDNRDWQKLEWWDRDIPPGVW